MAHAKHILEFYSETRAVSAKPNQQPQRELNNDIGSSMSS